MNFWVKFSVLVWLWGEKEKQDYPSQTLGTTHYLRPKLSSVVMNIKHFWLKGCFAVSGLWDNDNSLSTTKTKIRYDEHQGFCVLYVLFHNRYISYDILYPHFHQPRFNSCHHLNTPSSSFTVGFGLGNFFYLHELKLIYFTNVQTVIDCITLNLFRMLSKNFSILNLLKKVLFFKSKLTSYH